MTDALEERAEKARQALNALRRAVELGEWPDRAFNVLNVEAAKFHGLLIDLGRERGVNFLSPAPLDPPLATCQRCQESWATDWATPVRMWWPCSRCAETGRS